MTADVARVLTGEVSTDAPDTLAAVTAAWLWSYSQSPDTRDAYERDIKHYVGWCEARSIAPLTATHVEVTAYAAALAQVPNIETGRPLAPSSQQRRLSAVSSWYKYLIVAGVAGVNPAASIRRPKVDGESHTAGLDQPQAVAVLAAAGDDKGLGGLLATAVITMLLQVGPRVSEVCNLDIADLGHNGPHRTVRYRMKGGKTRTRAMPPGTGDALDRYLLHRAHAAGVSVESLIGPVFVSAGRRIDRHAVKRATQRAAKAARWVDETGETRSIPNPERVTPHVLRHAWATLARQGGASLEERQYALGHSDPKTTQRYDRARMSLDNDPSYRVDIATGGGGGR